jgi:hypothetical protein
MSHDPQQNPAAEPGWTEIGDDAQYERVILTNMHFTPAEYKPGEHVINDVQLPLGVWRELLRDCELPDDPPGWGPSRVLA